MRKSRHYDFVLLVIEIVDLYDMKVKHFDNCVCLFYNDFNFFGCCVYSMERENSATWSTLRSVVIVNDSTVANITNTHYLLRNANN